MRYGRLINGHIEYAPIRNGALVTADGIVFCPSAETLNNNGYYEIVNIEDDGEDAIVDGKLMHYIGAPVVDEYKPTYEERVVALIREKYTIDDELAILRQRDSKPDEFAEYNAYCENCKTQAKDEL